MKRVYFLLIAFCILVSCGGNGTTSVGNPTDAVITIGRLSAAGSSTITIPLAVFGDSESDLTDASIDVTKNGTAIVSDLSPATYYSDSLEAVRFVLSGLSDGDELAFVIALSDGSSETYEGTVSDETDTEATSEEQAGSGSYELANFYGVWSVDSEYWEDPSPEDPSADNLVELIIGGSSCSNEVQFNTEDEVSAVLERATYSVSGTTLTIANTILGTEQITNIAFGGTFGVENDYYFTGTFNGTEETFTLIDTLSCEIVEP